MLDTKNMRKTTRTKTNKPQPRSPKMQVALPPPAPEDAIPTPPVIVIDDAEEHTPKAQLRRGRRKNPHFLTFTEAREFVRSEMIPSRSKFEEWWDRNKPKSIPRFPYRVYREEWKSWNDFLGTDNKFNEKVGTKWRSIQDALVFVHPQRFKTSSEWLEWCRIPGNLPSDIPARPDLVYDTWRSWNHWLGITTTDVLQAKKEQQRNQVFYVVREVGAPANVVTVGVDPSGLSSLKEKWLRERFEILRVFWFDPELGDQITAAISSCSSAYQSNDRIRLVPNVWELIWQLSLLMEAINKA